MHRDLVSLLLRDPVAASTFGLSDWDLLVRQARRAGLLARLLTRLRQHGVAEHVPEQALLHLESALTVADRQAVAVAWEARMLRDALADTGVPIVLLKGAAYVMARLSAAQGRTFSDVDILVPEASLPEVESALMLAGWHGDRRNAYDQRYYREWMHEIPPMQHWHRGTTVDVHHGILPRTARLKPNSEKLLAAAVDLPGSPGLKVLSPVDMVLHSATHLFHNEELSMGPRDLSDLDHLLREFGESADFWQDLPDRAADLDLTRPLYYALRYAARQYATPVPPDTMAALEALSPAWPVRTIMDGIYRRMLAPHHESL